MKSLYKFAPILLLLSLALFSCKDDEEDDFGFGSGNGLEDQSDLIWSEVDLYTLGANRENQPKAYITIQKFPLHWDDPEGEKIDFYIKRIRASKSRVGSIWLLPGGPGQSSVPMEGLGHIMHQMKPELDIYMPDHRGTGRSSPLICNELYQEDDNSTLEQILTKCGNSLTEKWGDKLSGFNTTEAATDIGKAIELTRLKNGKVFVLGVSYGTYWIHRYLQLFPDQAEGIILDSMLPPTPKSLPSDQNKAIDKVGERFLEYCTSDETCGYHMGADPKAKMLELLTKMETGQCVEVYGPGSKSLRYGMAVLFGSFLETFFWRDFIPVLAYRSLRCSEDDISWLNHFYYYYLGETDQSKEILSYSLTLNWHIVLSEIVEREPNFDEVLAFADEATFLYYYPSNWTNLFDTWPTYQLDQYDGKWAETDLPMVMLNGDLDGRTPIEGALAYRDHFNGPNQYFHRLPRVSHSTIYNSPYANFQGDCGLRILYRFLPTPQKYSTDPCVNAIEMPDFVGDEEANLYYLGSKSRWEGWTPPTEMGTQKKSAARPFQKLLERIRKNPLLRPEF